VLNGPWLRQAFHLEEAHPLHMSHHRQGQGWQGESGRQRIKPGQYPG
jgi:hypothetical protein